MQIFCRARHWQRLCAAVVYRACASSMQWRIEEVLTGLGEEYGLDLFLYAVYKSVPLKRPFAKFMQILFPL